MIFMVGDEWAVRHKIVVSMMTDDVNAAVGERLPAARRRFWSTTRTGR
jgi:hypothetical protein